MCETSYDRLAGCAWLYLGGPDGPERDGWWWVDPRGTAGFARFGDSVASAGDVDGDGFDDVLMGSPGDSPTGQEARAFLFLGSPDGLLRADAWIGAPPGPRHGTEFGASVASAGDVDGDGLDDVVVGAPPFHGGAPDEGAAWLYLGRLP